MATTQTINIKPVGTTYASPPSSSRASVPGLAPAPKVASGYNDVDHRRTTRRFFLGPMPEKTAVQEVKKHKLEWLDRKLKERRRRRVNTTSTTNGTEDTDAESSSDSTDSEHLDHQSLFDFFIKSGGKEEEWGPQEAHNTRQTIRKMWEESGWAIAWRDRKKKEPARKWIGSSFAIGEPITASGDPNASVSSTSQGTPGAGSLSGPSGVKPPDLTVSLTPPIPDEPPSSLPSPGLGGLSLNSPTAAQFTTSHPNTSSTGLLHTANFRDRPEVRERPVSASDAILISESPVSLTRTGTAFTTGSDGHDPLGRSSGLRSALKNAEQKGKGKSVNWDRNTAAPEEVLARTASGIQDTSAEAAQRMTVQKEVQKPITSKDIIMKDRMLVKVSYSRTEGLPHPYDEHEARKHRGAIEEDWAECLVCWRGNHLEIYEDWSLPGKSWFIRGKNLAFIVPLRKPKSRLSLYSLVDSSFCITCPPTPVTKGKGKAPVTTESSSRRTIFHRADSGTNIFVFNCKTRSRAIDWMFHLWQQLGGEIPQFLEVRCPEIGSRVKVEIPDVDPNDGGEGYKVMTRQHVIGLCQRALEGLDDWETIIAHELQRGRRLELCWRLGTNVEWIWLDNDIDGNRRHWAVVYFAGFRQLKNPSHLEIRMAHHAPTEVVLADGTKLKEPPGIEGYLQRVKPSSQSKAWVYLSSHDGNLFTMSQARSYPPTPPSPPSSAEENRDNLKSDEQADAENRRGSHQILTSEGYLDFRSVTSIRRASTPNAVKFIDVDNAKGNIPAVNSSNLTWHDTEADFLLLDEEEPTADDLADTGGEEYVPKDGNKVFLKMRRSFELVLRNGHVIRYEAHSCSVALDWIGHLRPLVSYWTRRHRVDARQENDLLKVAEESTPWGSPATGPGAIADAPYLGDFWNWCILEGCRPIIKAGRLFVKRGSHKLFKQMYHVLTAGHVVLFHITATKSATHHRSRSINLLDAYVYSGQSAVVSLPRSDAQAEATPKRYQDGLEADDTDEDVTFIVWYRPHTVAIAATDPTHQDSNAKIPPLNGKHKVLICKARTKLERDAWCFALKSEIERVARSTAARERRIRDIAHVV